MEAGNKDGNGSDKQEDKAGNSAKRDKNAPSGAGLEVGGSVLPQDSRQPETVTVEPILGADRRQTEGKQPLQKQTREMEAGGERKISPRKPPRRTLSGQSGLRGSSSGTSSLAITLPVWDSSGTKPHEFPLDKIPAVSPSFRGQRPTGSDYEDSFGDIEGSERRSSFWPKPLTTSEPYFGLSSPSYGADPRRPSERLPTGVHSDEPLINISVDRPMRRLSIRDHQRSPGKSDPRQVGLEDGSAPTDREGNFGSKRTPKKKGNWTKFYPDTGRPGEENNNSRGGCGFEPTKDEYSDPGRDNSMKDRREKTRATSQQGQPTVTQAPQEEDWDAEIAADTAAREEEREMLQAWVGREAAGGGESPEIVDEETQTAIELSMQEYLAGGQQPPPIIKKSSGKGGVEVRSSGDQRVAQPEPVRNPVSRPQTLGCEIDVKDYREKKRGEAAGQQGLPVFVQPPEKEDWDEEAEMAEREEEMVKTAIALSLLPTGTEKSSEDSSETTSPGDFRADPQELVWHSVGANLPQEGEAPSGYGKDRVVVEVEDWDAEEVSLKETASAAESTWVKVPTEEEDADIKKAIELSLKDSPLPRTWSENEKSDTPQFPREFDDDLYKKLREFEEGDHIPPRVWVDLAVSAIAFQDTRVATAEDIVQLILDFYFYRQRHAGLSFRRPRRHYLECIKTALKHGNFREFEGGLYGLCVDYFQQPTDEEGAVGGAPYSF